MKRRDVAILVLLALLVTAAAWWNAEEQDRRLLERSSVRVASGPSSTLGEPFLPIAEVLERERDLTDAADGRDDRYRDPMPDGPAPLDGRVVSTTGESVGAGVRVLALLPSEVGDLAQVERLRDGAVEERRVLTDGEGRFRFPPLPNGVLYRVMAGGRGFVSSAVGPAYAPGSSELVVPVDAVYGVELRLVQTGGAPLPSKREFGPELLRADARDTSELLTDPLAAVVAGVRVAQLGEDRHHRALLQVRRMTAGGDALGPWTFTLEGAGFLPRLEEITLPRMGDELATRTFELEPVPGVRFGVLDVRLLGWPAEFGKPEPDARLGRLTMDPPDEFGSDWILDLRGRDLDGCRIEGVPQGAWSWTFHAASQCYARYAMQGEEPLLADVGAGSSELVIDLCDTGHLQLDVVAVAASETARHWMVTIVPKSGGVGATHRAVDGRLDLPFLRPGDYVARAQRRSDRGVDTKRGVGLRWDLVDFTIAAGAVTRAEIVLGD